MYKFIIFFLAFLNLSGCYQYLMNHSPVYNYMPRMKSPTDVSQES